MEITEIPAIAVHSLNLMRVTAIGPSSKLCVLNTWSHMRWTCKSSSRTTSYQASGSITTYFTTGHRYWKLITVPLIIGKLNQLFATPFSSNSSTLNYSRKSLIAPILAILFRELISILSTSFPFSFSFSMLNIDAAAFNANCLRFGRVLNASGYHKWRWTGFLFGLDLVLVADNKMFSIRRMHRTDQERLLSSQNTRHILAR